MYYPRNRFAYWIPTVLIALNFSFGGASSVLRDETSMEIYRKLGYPDYFGIMLGMAQLLAIAAILLPVPNRLRE